MFGLFKRTKIQEWEIQLLRNVILKLPKEYLSLMNQINDGLFRGVLVDISDIPGYVCFTFHSNLIKKYDRAQERDFKLTNIKVYDRKSCDFLNYEIYISSGTINGYSLEGKNRRNIDVEKVDVSKFMRVFIGESDYNRIINIFNKEEKAFLNPSQIYSVHINDKEYYHIKELGDGDFVGMDHNNNIYKITHDPLELSLITRIDLLKILKREGF